MSEHPHASEQAAGSHEDHDEHHINYTKIYVILLVLLVISILGPELEIVWVTLITAFGVALVKANLVIQNFMHLRPEKAVVKWMLASSLLLMGLFFFGVAPDVMKHEGRNWENRSAKAVIAQGIATEDHGEEGEEHAEEGAGEGAMGGGEEEAAPVAEVAFSAESAYQMTCSLCHGAQGAGDGVGGQALDPAPANFASPDYWAQATDEQMFTVIKNGGPAAGKSAAMAAWGSLYDDEQIYEIIEYIKTFRP